MDIEVIISGILTVLTVIAGGYVVKFKSVINDLRVLIAEVSEALSDNQISSDEWNAIVEAFNQLLSNFTSASNRSSVIGKMKTMNAKRKTK